MGAGAIVDREDRVVRIDENIVREALRTAPSQFTLTSRNPEKQIVLGGDNLVFGLVAGPPFVHDRLKGRRSGNLEDYRNFIRLAHTFNAIHLIGNQVTAPQELPANSRHLDTYFANLTLSDLCFHCTAIGRGRAMDGIRMMAISRGITLEEMATSPGVITIININSPRLLDDAMGDGLIAMAQAGQPVTVTPFTLMGAMTPVTLPAALAQQNAEALFGVVLTQLANPGAPVMYGAFTSNVDMKSGAPAFGTPENTKANIIAGQLARRYDLPYRTSNANASTAVDLQAAYETGMSTWGAVLGGANMIYHAAGWLEGGLVASYEKLILDVEILQNMMEFLRPIAWSEDELGFDAIAQVPTVGTSSASTTPWRATRPPSTRPCSPIGATTRAGRPRARGRRSIAPRTCGSRRSRNTRSRPSIPQSARSSRPTWRSARKRSARAILEPGSLRGEAELRGAFSKPVPEAARVAAEDGEFVGRRLVRLPDDHAHIGAGGDRHVPDAERARVEVDPKSLLERRPDSWAGKAQDRVRVGLIGHGCRIAEFAGEFRRERLAGVAQGKPGAWARAEQGQALGSASTRACGKLEPVTGSQPLRKRVAPARDHGCDLQIFQFFDHNAGCRGARRREEAIETGPCLQRLKHGGALLPDR
jgi:hypothetical protein